jgi:hypothetical protein
MSNIDRSVKVILATIAFFLGMIAVRPLFEPSTTVLAQPARFDHVFIVSTVFIYKGQQGMLVMDRRNANVWFIPKLGDQFKDPTFVMRLPFEKLDQAPH